MHAVFPRAASHTTARHYRHHHRGDLLGNSSPNSAAHRDRNAHAHIVPHKDPAAAHHHPDTDADLHLHPRDSNTLPTLTPLPTFSSGGGGSSGGGSSSGSSKYSCHFVSQIPENGTRMGSRNDFDWEITLINTGERKWPVEDKYMYVRGDKFHRYSEYNFPEEVVSGQEITLIVDMEAPKEPGSYLTTWALNVNGETFCYFSLQIIVEK